MARKLRAVSENETPAAPAKPKTVTEAASAGTPRELLVAMRDRVAKAVESADTPARDLAALTKRLMDITNELKALDAAAREDARDSGDVPDEAFDESAI